MSENFSDFLNRVFGLDTKPKSKKDLTKMSKVKLEEYGRSFGIELDRRYTKDTLVEQLMKEVR